MYQRTFRRNGRPPHVPTEQQKDLVSKLHVAGATQPQIAARIGINESTLRLRYRAELSKPSPAARAAASERFHTRFPGRRAARGA